MSEVRDALNALKRDTGMDYTHADAETQEEMADLYLAVVAAQRHNPPEPTDEEKQESHEQHLADVYERYKRNSWNMPKEYDGIDWERIITVNGAAEMLGVSRFRVHQLLDDGKLVGKKVDKVWLIDKASVEARIAK